MSEFTILYVEDNKIIQKLVKVILKKYFRDIYIANNGEEGLIVYKKKKPDIVLADISMPTMDGFDMIKNIKKINPYQKIALLTGYNNKSYLNRAINIGVDKYILKPLQSGQMLSALGDIIKSLKIEKEQKEYKEELEYASKHDELTGLCKRNFFYQKLDALIDNTLQVNKNIAILSIDLNLFKEINDTYGHDTGDAVLKRVAQNLLKSVRKEDIVSRFGGDEFAVAIGHLKDISDIFSFLKRIEEYFSEPLIYIDNDIEYYIPISLSIGITFVSKDYNNISIQDLLKQSDKAMYIAKKAGTMYSFFDSNCTILDKDNQKIKEIEKAIENREFTLYYQPIVDIESREIIAFESLIRWINPKKGILSPDNFLPYILDNIKIMSTINRFVINSVFSQIELWNKRGYNFVIAINISQKEIESSEFLKVIKESLDKYPMVKPNRVIFEIKESIAIKNIEIKDNIISKLKKLGFKITIDNFGTGESNIIYIKKFKVNSIKIDKKFIIDMLNNEEYYSIVNASIELAKIFGYEAIAEGVETKEHISTLLQLGCQKAQGYSIAKPMPSYEVEKFINSYYSSFSLSYGLGLSK